MITREMAVGDGCSVLVTKFGTGGGPTLAVLGGVHGDELEGIVACGIVSRELVSRELAGAQLRGQVRIVSVANPPARQAGTRISPVDGGNLARSFPGKPDGTLTERIARTITDEVIAGADLLVDLHSAGTHYEMPIFAGYDATAAAGSRSAQAAYAFGAPIVWRHDGIAPGRSLSAAAGLGIPAIYAEGSGGGTLRGGDVDVYVTGVHHLLHWLGITGAPADGAGGAAAPGGPILIAGGDGDVDASVACHTAGYCITRVRLGEEVAAGQVLGEIVDLGGARLEEVVAPRAGQVMMLRRTAQISPGDGVVMLAPAQVGLA